MIFYIYILFERVYVKGSVIMMKRVLMATLCLSCVTLGGHAIDINIPGADPTVSKDAYQNYRKTDADAQQMERDVEKDIKTYMPKQVVGNGEFDLNDIIYSNRELNHALDFSSSIFILKEDGANVKFTMPYSSRYGNTEKIADGTPAFRNAMIMSPDGMMAYELRHQPAGNNWEDSKIPYSKLTVDDMKVIAEKTAGVFRGDDHSLYAGKFTYPTVEKATWDVTYAKDAPMVGSLNFTMKNTPTISYHVGYNFMPRKQFSVLKAQGVDKTKDMIMSPLVNYVLPSIEPAKDIFSKSKALTINDFTFLTLKTSKMIREDKNDSYMYVYDSDQYREGIMVMPVEADDIQHPDKIFPKAVRSIILTDKYSMHQPIQFATVWNDAMPSVYIQIKRPKTTIYMLISHDKQYVYNHFIMTNNARPLIEKDLRDIVQYVDTNNNKDYYNTFLSGLGAKMPKDMATVDIKSTK